ncbi:MAG: HIT family protein [Candidatus Woesearchaeota archaeon]
METIFTKIINRQVPAYIIYEDDDFLSFLDIHPHAKGHTLVIPKQPVKTLLELDAQQSQALVNAIQKTCDIILPAAGATDCSVLTRCGALAGQEIFHMHVHIVPSTQEHPVAYGSAKYEYDLQAFYNQLKR